jgi:hypothetical protein
MNPGVSEEASKAVVSTVEALKSTPVVLALVIFNLLFMAGVVYISIKTGERWDKEISRWETLVHACQQLKV